MEGGGLKEESLLWSIGEEADQPHFIQQCDQALRQTWALHKLNCVLRRYDPSILLVLEDINLCTNAAALLSFNNRALVHEQRRHAPPRVDMEQDFAEEPLCTSSVGAPPPEYGTSGMLHGPTIRHSMAKNDMKVDYICNVQCRSIQLMALIKQMMLTHLMLMVLFRGACTAHGAFMANGGREGLAGPERTRHTLQLFCWKNVKYMVHYNGISLSQDVSVIGSDNANAGEQQLKPGYDPLHKRRKECVCVCEGKSGRNIRNAKWVWAKLSLPLQSIEQVRTAPGAKLNMLEGIVGKICTGIACFVALRQVNTASIHKQKTRGAKQRKLLARPAISLQPYDQSRLLRRCQRGVATRCVSVHRVKISGWRRPSTSGSCQTWAHLQILLPLAYLTAMAASSQL
eukprot:scaffold37863_cov17-Tisochrysis_lutea.AAC.4